MPNLPIVVSTGCPSGIGPEVSLLAASELASEKQKLVLVGDVAHLTSMADMLRVNRKNWGVSSLGAPLLHPVTLVQAGPRLRQSERIFGKPAKASGVAQLAYIDEAIQWMNAGQAAAMVTGPVNKAEVVRSRANPHFTGHTEYLRDRAGVGEVTMAFWTPAFTTALVTTHIPLRDVARAIDETSVLRAVRHLAEFVCEHGDAKKPIYVCGLNPHAGESGLIGTEETKIKAALRKFRLADGPAIVGPVGAETVFRFAKDGNASGVVAMYHDQATIPTKLLGFGEAVNVTLGLPYIRTSVDHGTGYDVAGKGIARADGMISAIQLAIKIAKGAESSSPPKHVKRTTVAETSTRTKKK